MKLTVKTANNIRTKQEKRMFSEQEMFTDFLISFHPSTT